jgi:hypothetical protein
MAARGHWRDEKKAVNGSLIKVWLPWPVHVFSWWIKDQACMDKNTEKDNE